MHDGGRGPLWRFGQRVRRRLLYTVLAFGLGAGMTWYWREEIFNLLFAPASGQLSPFAGMPVFLNPTEMLAQTFGLAMRGGLMVAGPVAALSFFSLIAPLFTVTQRRCIWVLLPLMIASYLGGVAFTYFVLLPTGMGFLLQFGQGIATPLISVSAYLTIASTLMFWLGLVFQIPFVMYFLVRLRLVPRSRFAKFRKYLPVAALFLSAIITPTFDVANQLMVAVPIVILYEFGLFLSWVAEGKPAAFIRRQVEATGRMLRKCWAIVVDAKVRSSWL